MKRYLFSYSVELKNYGIWQDFQACKIVIAANIAEAFEDLQKEFSRYGYRNLHIQTVFAEDVKS